MADFIDKKDLAKIPKPNNVSLRNSMATGMTTAEIGSPAKTFYADA